MKECLFQAIIDTPNRAPYSDALINGVDRLKKQFNQKPLDFTFTNDPSDPYKVEINIKYKKFENVRTVYFQGYSLDVDTGNIYFSPHRINTPVLLGNYFEAMREKVPTFNESEFLYKLECFKLTEIESATLFTSEVPTISSGSICKRYLVADTATGVSFAQETCDFFKAIIEIAKGISEFLGSLRRDGSYILVDDDDFMGCYFNGAPNYFRTLAVRTGYKSDLSTLNQVTQMYGLENPGVGVEKFLNAKDLLGVSSDADDQIIGALSSDAETLKKVIKASPLKDFIKGSVLSSVVKKKDYLVNSLLIDFTDFSSMYSIGTVFRKATSFLKLAFSKIKI